MHTGLAAQQTKSVITFDFDRRAAYARNITRSLFQYLGLKAFAFAITQILAQQHAGPVAGFGSTSASLNVDKAIEGVSRVIKHPPKLQVMHDYFEFFGFTFDCRQSGD